MSITYFQNATNTTTGSPATIACTFGSNVVAGDLLIAVSFDNNGLSVTSVTDTQSSTWNELSVSTGGYLVTFWYAVAAAGYGAGGAGAVTFHLTGTNGGNTNNFAALEYTVSGVAPSLDGSGTNGFQSPTLAVTTTAAAGAADTVIGGYSGGNGTTLSTPGGYTKRLTLNSGGGGSFIVFDKTASGSGTQTASSNITGGGATASGVLANFQQLTAALVDPGGMTGMIW